MADHKPKPIKPKSQTFDHAGQRYTCTFDPNAPKEQQWVWEVAYVRTYRYWGSAPSMEKASASARRRIHALNKRVIASEECDG